MSQKSSLSPSICILRLSSIGDITHIIPIIKTIQHNLPKSDITWIIGKTEYPLVKNMKGVRFIIIDKSKTISSIINLKKEVKNRVFEILLHMQKSLRSRILSFFIKAKKRLGYKNVSIPEESHVLDTFFYFLEEIGIKEKLLDWSLDFDHPSKEILKNKKKYVVFNPFTSSRRFNYREWKLDNFRLVAKYLSDKYNLDSVMVGGNSEYEITESRKIGSDNFIHNLVGKTNLQDLCNVIKNCQFYIGPDSGTMHIASMFSKPTIGLFATSNPRRTGPYQNQKYIINKYNEALRIYMNTREGNVRWGTRVRNKNAMSLISVNHVIEMIDKIQKDIN
tara:strand:+ start:178 stop:1179 length:1002 start_codon:yes stop_codon:yes gene_type:complete